MPNNNRSQREINLFAFIDALIPPVTTALTAVIGATDANHGELVGTGTLISAGGSLYILTASHVAHKVNEYPLQGYSTGRNNRIETICSEFIHHPDPNLDIAVLPINHSSLIGNNKSPLDISVFCPDTIALNDYLAIFGYPGQASRYSAIANGLLSTIQPYGTVEGTSALSISSPSNYFAIEYPAEGQETSEGRIATLPNPGGLSGTLVWKANSEAGSLDNWQVGDAKVAGLVHRWDTNHSSLVVTRSEFIVPFILQLT